MFTICWTICHDDAIMNITLMQHIPHSIRPEKALPTLLDWYTNRVLAEAEKDSSITVVFTQIVFCRDIVCTVSMILKIPVQVKVATISSRPSMHSRMQIASTTCRESVQPSSHWSKLSSNSRAQSLNTAAGRLQGFWWYCLQTSLS